MIHDYYLFEGHIKNFEEWDKEKENSFNVGSKKKKWKEKNKKEKYKLWLDEIFVHPLAQEKREIQRKLGEDKNIDEYYPKSEDLKNLPRKSVLIKISFTLKKPYLSKGEGEFHILNGRIFENPIVRDKFTGLPMVRPSTWKGHLRFATEKAEWEEMDKKKIIKRLFGSESGEDKALKGRLYFFPTFFEEEAEKDVITPLDRKTRTPVKGRSPIPIEIMKPGSKGEFYLLYVPYPKGKDFKEDQIKEDLRFLAEALKLMFYVYGFSAKKTSGFGVIKEKLNEGKFWIKSNIEIKEETFSQLDKLENKLTKLLRDGDG